jgi:Domain of unknown function (DUF5615)
MRFLANENFPGAAITALEAAGHDVVWVRMAAPGTTDPDVLALAAREERILLTFDKDFRELARGSALPRTCGVVLLRTPMPRPGDVGQRLADVRGAKVRAKHAKSNCDFEAFSRKGFNLLGFPKTATPMLQLRTLTFAPLTRRPDNGA